MRSLLRSEYPAFEVIAVNDRSTDRTGELLRAIDSPRLTVVDGEERPAGWAGKPWACWQGFQRAKGPVLLFTDADTEHGPRLLPRAVSMLLAEKAGLVTVMPHQEMKSFWERQVQPYFFLMLGVRYGSPERMNRNTNPRDAIANGQFILVTRASYEAVGGHQRVKGSVIEDLELAASYTADRQVLRFALADQDMCTRMYQSLPEIIEGWSKNTFVGTMHTMKTRPLTALAMIGNMIAASGWFLLPLVMLALGLAGSRPAPAAFGLAAWLGSSMLMGAMLKAGRENPLWALFHPLGALVTEWIFLRALLRGTKRIEWKGRTYSTAT